MIDIGALIRELGGLAATHELHQAGVTRANMTAAVRRRLIVRVRQGWYATPQTHPTLLAGARVGGWTTCSTGLELQGVWVVRDARFHVRVPEHVSRLRDARTGRRGVGRSAVVHWHGDDPPTGGRMSRLLLDPIACMKDLLSCASPELCAAAGDSLLREHPELRSRWQAFVSIAPERARAALRLVDGVCESGTETIVWHRLGRALHLRRQVEVDGIGRLDFLAGDRLNIEVDGAEYHIDPDRFEADRRRDAALSAIGYRVLRFSYPQVLYHWDEVERSIRAAIARSDNY